MTVIKWCWLILIKSLNLLLTSLDENNLGGMEEKLRSHDEIYIF